MASSPLYFHPETEKILQYLSENATGKSLNEIPLDLIRHGHDLKAHDLSTCDDISFDVSRTEQVIPSPHDPKGIPVYIYTAKKLESTPKILVYFHGGGMVLGRRLDYDTFCNTVAQNAGCIVVNVEYRLAPEHKLPAAFDDAIVAVNWVKANKTHLGGTISSKVGVGGDSAGGTITASVTHDVPADFQILVYPQVFKARDYSTPSMQRYKDGPLLDLAYIKWFEDHSIPIGEESNPRIANILRPSFEHLPPALVIIAEHDVLYDSSHAYAKKLQEAGVSVEVHEFKGAIHAFFGYAKMCPELTSAAYDMVVKFIKAQ